MPLMLATNAAVLAGRSPSACSLPLRSYLLRDGGRRAADRGRDSAAGHTSSDGAELVDSVSVAGKLSGNGNGMQYLGVPLIRSDETLSELATSYDTQSINNAPSIEVATREPQPLRRTPGFLGETGEPRCSSSTHGATIPGWLFRAFDVRRRHWMSSSVPSGAAI